jgi:sulfhydrogenase subunit gamma (sulfur reductase)
MRSEDYMPRFAQIEDIRIETDTEKTFTMRLPDDDPGVVFTPGQFIELSVLGAGEAPFGLASSPAETHVFQSTVRRYSAGVVTVPLHRMQVGDFVGVRGPLGNGFPLKEHAGDDILLIAGGLGLPTLRAAVFYLLDHRDEYGDITLLYGARTPQDRLYKHDLETWSHSPLLQCYQTVDVADENWDGEAGYVSQLVEKLQLDPEKTSVYMCGPAVMINPVVEILERMGLTDEQMYVNMEAHMKCGVGKCGHCLIRDKYVCLDGPVFTYGEVKQMQQFQDAI